MDSWEARIGVQKSFFAATIERETRCPGTVGLIMFQTCRRIEFALRPVLILGGLRDSTPDFSQRAAWRGRAERGNRRKRRYSAATPAAVLRLP